MAKALRTSESSLTLSTTVCGVGDDDDDDDEEDDDDEDDDCAAGNKWASRV